MRCERVQKLYDDFIVNDLPPATLAQIEEHLAGCAECRGLYDSMDDLALLLRQTGEVAHPGGSYFDDMTAKVMARLESGEAATLPPPPPLKASASARMGRPVWWAGSAAAALLLGVAILPAMLHSGAAPQSTHIASNNPAGLSLVASGTPLPMAPNSADPTAEPPKLLPAELARAMDKMAAQPAASTLDKGITGRNSNQPDVEQMMATSQRMRTALINTLFGTGPNPTETELKAQRETEVRMVKLKQDATENKVLPHKLLEQIQVLKAQMLDGSAGDLRKEIDSLESQLGQQIDESFDVQSLPIIQQMQLYMKAEDSLLSGRPDDASVSYHRILLSDETSAIALRAYLQLADLSFAEYADFGKALDYYRRCTGVQSQAAFTTHELEHIQRQIEKLEKYRASNWQALNMVNLARRGTWPEAKIALERLAEMPDAAPLLPEASRALVQRLNRPGRETPDRAMVVEIYNLLANRNATEQNIEIRAWLEVAVGEIALGQFQDVQQAKARFRRAYDSMPDKDSGVARYAWQQLDSLVNQTLIERVR